MPNGSEEDSSVAGEVATLGNKMPEGAGDPLVITSAEDEVRAWVNSVHPVFAATKLAERLIDAGYDRMPNMYGVTEQRLIDGFKVKEGHAAQFVHAAERMRKENVSTATTLTTAGTYQKKRTPAPKVPVAAKGSQRCGVAGLGAVEDIRAWLPQVMSWARSNWGDAEASAVESIALDSASQAYDAEGVVDPEFDKALHYALVGDLPTTTMQFLGAAATGTSGLRVLQVLMQPVLGAKGHTSRQHDNRQ